MRELTRRDRAIRRLAAPAFLALVLGTAAPAGADEGVLSYFIGLRAIGTHSMFDDVRTSGFGGATNVENDSDEVAGIGFLAGTRFRDLPVRLELEVAHRFRFDFDVRDEAPGNRIDNEMNVSTTSALVSAILEWRNESSFTPFGGAGIGWARNDVETERTAFVDQSKSKRDKDTDNFAWGATVGVDWDFEESWSAQAAYRYMDLGEVDAGTSPFGDSISADSYTSHDLLLGVLYHF